MLVMIQILPAPLDLDLGPSKCEDMQTHARRSNLPTGLVAGSDSSERGDSSQVPRDDAPSASGWASEGAGSESKAPLLHRRACACLKRLLRAYSMARTLPVVPVAAPAAAAWSMHGHFMPNLRL